MNYTTSVGEKITRSFDMADVATSFGSVDTIDHLITEADEPVVRTVRAMLKSRGLAVRPLFIEDPDNPIRWILIGYPPVSETTAVDHARARLPTVVFRADCNFNGRNTAPKLLHRCWTAAGEHLRSALVYPNEVDRHIIILSGPLTKRKLVSAEIPQESPYVNTIPGHIGRMDVFDDRSLRYNILNHILVPAHKALGPSDLALLGERYGNNTNSRERDEGELVPTRSDPTLDFVHRIPRVDHMDPVVRFLGGVAYMVPGDMKSGTVYEINRGGGEISFRRVVNDLGR